MQKFYQYKVITVNIFLIHKSVNLRDLNKIHTYNKCVHNNSILFVNELGTFALM